jgi:electron transport complex protein RnfA
VVIASLVQFSAIVMKATQPLLHEVLGIFVPLITTNCAVLGVALLNTRAGNGFVDSILYGFGAALGFSGLLIIFAAIRERQSGADIPAPFQGSAINMITAGILSLAFLGFTGLS